MADGKEFSEAAVTHVLAVVGPTASGKTDLAAELAEALDTEVISADSMQVYRGMAIGTAQPSPAAQARAPHHFVGFLEPGEPFSAGAFRELALEKVRELNACGRIAVVAGGSGLYVRALIDGLFEGPGRDSQIRQRLHHEAEERGIRTLFERLRDVDPAYADAILPGDLRRIVRALEVHELTGTPLSEWHGRHQQQAPVLNALQIGIAMPRPLLYGRINRRAHRMLEAGFLHEVHLLLRAGHERHLERIRSLGYREAAAYLGGRMTHHGMVEAMKQNTRRFAKRQLSWFRRDERIHLLETGDPPNIPALKDQALRLLESDHQVDAV